MLPIETQLVSYRAIIKSMHAIIFAYMDFLDSLKSDFFIICLQSFWIIRTAKEIIYGYIEIVSNALK